MTASKLCHQELGTRRTSCDEVKDPGSRHYIGLSGGVEVPDMSDDNVFNQEFYEPRLVYHYVPSIHNVRGGAVEY